MALSELETLQSDVQTHQEGLQRSEVDLEKAESVRDERENKLTTFLDQHQPKERTFSEPNIPQWENSEEYKSAQLGKRGLGMGVALMMASLVGPLLMRTGAKGAMAALTAALTGWKEGDAEKWQNARDDYNKHINFMEKAHQKFMAEVRKIEADEHKDFMEKEIALRHLMIASGVDVKNAQAKVNEHLRAINNAHIRIQQLTKPVPQKSITAAQRQELAYQEAKKENPNLTRADFDKTYSAHAPSGGKGSSRQFTAPKAKTPAEWVAEVKSDPKFKDKTPEEIAAEAKKRAGVK